ncbi:putative Late embryogenesis abundant protein Lea5 [Melia azedarach]|uniref:Late embryogenesis abundant protein Lea5 n=1 Tax=Melia azedarach TaxID=155640 RepID=A0ACC1Y2L4_MELAZ|nr:putative Late embryogenesis abundant protein Lea5 [Melia azedarach]
MARAKMSIVLIGSCREVRRVYRRFSRFAKPVDNEEAAAGESFTGSLKEKKINSKVDYLTCWVPHPRSGIYFPEGQERVMEDVPQGAASLGGRTFWLRNDNDGVDKPFGWGINGLQDLFGD